MKTRIWTASLIVVALFAGAGLRTAVVASKRVVGTDEGISYLSATCHQGEYAAVAGGDWPYGSWVRAAEWKRFVEIEDVGCFRRIGSDLAKHDIHPPLYFWILHLWLLIGETTTVRWGPALNLIFALGTLLGTYWLGRRVLPDRRLAALGALILALAPGSLLTPLQARQYELWGMLTVLLAVLALDAVHCDSRRRLSTALLVPVCAALLLTHYHAPLVVAGVGLTIALPFWRTRRRQVLGVFVGLAVGVLLAVAVHPGFLESISRAPNQSQSFSPAEIGPRLWALKKAYAGFLLQSSVLRPGLRLWTDWLILLSLLGALVAPFWRWQSASPSQNTVRGLRSLSALTLWLVVSNLLLYVLAVSPRHAVGGKYLVFAYPLLAVLLAGLVGLGKRVWIGSILVLTLGAAAVHTVALHRVSEARLPDLEARLNDSDAVIVDTAVRLVVPAVSVHLPVEISVYAAEKTDIAPDLEWIDAAMQRAVWISVLPGKGSFPDYTELMRSVAREFEVESLPGLIADRGFVHLLERKRPTPPR